jgi:N-acetylneuraminic acid mutarotase
MPPQRPSRTQAVLFGVLVVAGASLIVAPSVSEEDTAREWRSGPSMSQRRSYTAATSLDGSIYVAGGMVGETGRRLATFQRFDPDANAWATLRSLPVGVRAAAAAASRGSIYVIGGATRARGSRQVYAYDVEQRRWQRRAPLPAGRQNHAAVEMNGRIYVLGGLDLNGHESREAYVYDPARDQWQVIVPLPRPVHALAAVTFDGRIWAIGGRTAAQPQRAVWTFREGSSRWERAPALPRPMELLGAASTGGRIHALTEDVYQIFDAQTQRWQPGPSPVVPRHALALIAVDDELYAIGGCTTALRDSQVVERIRLA